MAKLSERLRENVAGEFFVDASCIDCDTCRQIAPATFAGEPSLDQAIVHRQPATDAERERALMALVACPTASIGTVHKWDVRAAARRFPELIADDIYYCGFTSADSYGASSYLIRRAAGNVLVDSPRATPVLVDRLRELGGVRWLFLTHRDDVADHAKWVKHFGCARVMHVADLSADTRMIEHRIEGDAAVDIDADLRVIPVPGHTRGSIALLHRNVLFTGDHLWGSTQGDALEASRSVCWYSWSEQTRSVEKLCAYDFTSILPGHGRRFGARSDLAMREELRRLTDRMTGKSSVARGESFRE